MTFPFSINAPSTNAEIVTNACDVLSDYAQEYENFCDNMDKNMEILVGQMAAFVAIWNSLGSDPVTAQAGKEVMATLSNISHAIGLAATIHETAE